MNSTSQIQDLLQTAEHLLLQWSLRAAHYLWGAWHAVIGWAWTPPIAILTIAAVLLLWTSYAHRRWKKGWLSGLIAQRLSAIKKQRPPKQRALPLGRRGLVAELRLTILERWDDLLTYFRNKFIADLRAPHFPSLVSFAVLAILIAVFFLVSRPPQLANVLHWHWQDWWRVLTADLSSENTRTEGLVVGAFTGLAVVVIALVVFVAESIRDDKDYERKRVLVRISLLWPLGLAATLIPFGFLWSASRGFTILLEIIVAGITLAAFGRVIRALFDPEVRASDRLALLRGRVRGMIFDSVRERVGNTVLLEQLGAGKRIDTLHYMISRVWIEDEPQSYLFIDAPKDGWIGDIQLEELRKLGDRLDRHAREALGFALRESGPDVQAGMPSGGAARSTVAPLKVKKAYLLKRYREEIPPDSIFYGKSRSLFALPEAFAQSPAVLADVRAAIPHIFRFTKEEPSSAAIRREMQGTKDQLAQAIRDHALGEIDELRQAYLQIAEEFLSLLVELGGGYSAEQAQKERGNYFESWTEIRWLLSDLRELIIIAVGAGNTDVLDKIAFLPFAIAMRAVQARDHFVFQQFFQFASLLYILAIEKDEGSPVRGWMVERSWRWPKEIADFYIGHELDAKASAPKDLEQMRDFALYSLRVFQDLLKLMADKRDITAFATVAHEFRRLYRRFREADNQPNVAILRFQLEHVQSDEERTSLTAHLERQEKRQDVAAAINMAMDEIFLALGGRVLAQRLEAPEDALIGRLLDAIMALLPNSLQNLAATFAEASGWHASDAWGWNQWDLVADGEAHWVDSHTKLNQIFAVRALQLLAALLPEARMAIQLPASHALAEMAREGNAQGLLATLNAIEANPERWQTVLSQEARNCVGVLRERLSAALSADQELTAERTRNAPLDSEKIAAFRDELIRSFAESRRLRHILEAKGALEINLNNSPGATVRSLGINQIDDKDAFIAQEHTSYAGWGRGYGQGIAQGEDEEAFAVMIGAAKTKQTIIPGSIVTTIGRVITEAMLKDPIILQSLVFNARYAEIERNSNFTPKYNPGLDTPWRDFNGFMGVLAFGTRQVPVFDTFVRRPDSQNKILVLDALRFLRWDQFAPDHEPDEQTYAEGQLLIRVIDLNSDLKQRDEIITQNPPWLAQQPDPIAYLRGRVLVNVYEKFHIKILDASQAVCLTLPDAVDDDG
jgi:hypothetical protein